MEDTRGNDGTSISEFTSYAHGSAFGFDVFLCEWDDCPFILLKAKKWRGVQPRYAYTLSSGLEKAAKDIARIGLIKETIHHRFVGEDPIRLAYGIHGFGEFPASEPKGIKELWLSLTR